MSGFSTYLAQAAINHFVRRSAQSVPDGTHLALFVADPTDNNVTANEVTGAWYTRQDVTSWAAPVGTGSTTSNSNQVAFPAVTGNAVTVTHWGIYDAGTSGNLLFSGELTMAKVLNVDDVLVIGANDLTLDFQ